MPRPAQTSDEVDRLARLLCEEHGEDPDSLSPVYLRSTLTNRDLPSKEARDAVAGVKVTVPRWRAWGDRAADLLAEERALTRFQAEASD